MTKMMMTQTRKQPRKRIDTQKKIGPMHRGQQKIKLVMNKPRGVLPPLPLPYPPTIQLQKMVAKLASKPKLARFPNAFIMYRNEYVQFLKAKDLHLSMTELSPMIAAAWKQEPEYVKDAYTQLSSEAEKLYVRVAANAQPEIKYKFPIQRHSSFNDYNNNNNSSSLSSILSSSASSTSSTSSASNDENHQLPIIQRNNNNNNKDNDQRSANENILKFGNNFVSDYSRLLESSPIPDPKNFPHDVNNHSNSSRITFPEQNSSSAIMFDGRDPSINNDHNAILDAQIFDNTFMKQESCFIQEPHFTPWTTTKYHNNHHIPDVRLSPPQSSSISCNDYRIPSPEELIYGSLPSPILTSCSEMAFAFPMTTCINCNRRQQYYEQQQQQQHSFASYGNKSSAESDFYPLSPVSPTLTFVDDSPMQSPIFSDYDGSDITSDLYYVIDNALSFGPYDIISPHNV